MPQSFTLRLEKMQAALQVMRDRVAITSHFDRLDREAEEKLAAVRQPENPTFTFERRYL